jgi:hypothetical protein
MHDQLMGVLQKAMDPSQPLLQPITAQTLDPQGIAHPTGVHITALLRQLCCSMQVRRALRHAVPCCICSWHCRCNSAGAWRMQHACMKASPAATACQTSTGWVLMLTLRAD